MQIIANPVGHPDEFKEEYCELLIEHMSLGKSFESFAGHPLVKACRATLYNWAERHPKFLDAKKKGESGSLFWHEDLIHRATVNPKDCPVNTALLCFKMKNQHGWADKVEHSTDSKSVPIIQLKYKIEKK